MIDSADSEKPELTNSQWTSQQQCCLCSKFLWLQPLFSCFTPATHFHHFLTMRLFVVFVEIVISHDIIFCITKMYYIPAFVQFNSAYFEYVFRSIKPYFSSDVYVSVTNSFDRSATCWLVLVWFAKFCMYIKVVLKF